MSNPNDNPKKFKLRVTPELAEEIELKAIINDVKIGDVIRQRIEENIEGLIEEGKGEEWKSQ